MSATLTVLGSCGAWPEADKACSGFLLNYNGYRVALDLGYGTLPRLLSLLKSNIAEGLDALVITHSHPDHLVDAHGLMRARIYGATNLAPIPLYAPESVLNRLIGLEEGDDAAFHRAFTWTAIPGPEAQIGPFVLSNVSLPHFVENVGVRLTSDAFTFAYTGDTGPSAHVPVLGEHADLFVVDATDRYQQPGRPRDDEPNLLLDAAGAGQAAQLAKARRLMLTHFWPGNDREQSRREAARHFSGEILLAEEGLVVDI